MLDLVRHNSEILGELSSFPEFIHSCAGRRNLRRHLSPKIQYTSTKYKSFYVQKFRIDQSVFLMHHTFCVSVYLQQCTNLRSWAHQFKCCSTFPVTFVLKLFYSCPQGFWGKRINTGIIHIISVCGFVFVTHSSTFAVVLVLTGRAVCDFQVPAHIVAIWPLECCEGEQL